MFEILTKKKNNRKGFTLIELIVVIAILGILAAMLVPRFIGFTESAKVNRVANDCKTISKAIATYYADESNYPSSTELVSSGYFSAVPTGLTIPATPDGTFTVIETGYVARGDQDGRILIVKGSGTPSTSDLPGTIDWSATETPAANAAAKAIVYNSTRH